MTAHAHLPHILIVDDNLDAAEVLAILVEGEGFTVATARSVVEARERIAAQRPGLILLDMTLPDGHGMDLLAEVKNNRVTAGIEVVIVSGMADERLREEARVLGASAFLVKPLDSARLMDVLDGAR
jgi:CheY-like chemotaxis protein